MKEEATVWQGSLSLSDNGSVLTDVSLNSPAAVWQSHFPAGHLEFLAYVQPSLVPLHLLLGPSLRVVTNDERTQEWFSDVLLHETPLRRSEDESTRTHLPWHESAACQSRVGVLARPSSIATTTEQGPRPTEVLFYAERVQSDPSMRLPTPPPSSQNDETPGAPSDEICVRALVISSDLQPENLESLASRVDDGESRVVPLPQAMMTTSKKRLGAMFDEAFERRKRARHTTGRSISIAASRGGTFDKAKIKTEHSQADLEFSDTAPLEARTLQPRRVAKEAAEQLQRPASRKSFSNAKRPTPSSLASPLPDETSLEARNKETVSRTVMAGMRMHGLQQSKSSSKLAADEERDAEFKGVYHQTYKGTLFSFRRTVDTELLKPEAVRDVADRLLAIFCREPP